MPDSEPQAPAPFTDLPGALVEEVLGRAEQIGRALLGAFEEVRARRDTLRAGLVASGLLRREGDLPYPHVATTCGVDGSYAVERLLNTDLAATAAVAVEGLTPPSEERFWEAPFHQVFVETEVHSEHTTVVLRGLMIAMELALALKAPHEVVFLDGSVTTPLIYLNQCFSQAAKDGRDLRTAVPVRERAGETLAAYRDVLRSRRGDKCWVFSPKYTTNREVGIRLGWPESSDDRGLLSRLLEPGEFVGPIPLKPGQWHLSTAVASESGRAGAAALAAEVTAALSETVVLYYKPHVWLPALRLEVHGGVAGNPARLAVLLQAVKHQCGTPAIFEPYPLYLADRMVRNLARAVPAFRQAATQRIAEGYGSNLDEVFHGMHGYRTDGGR